MLPIRWHRLSIGRVIGIGPGGERNGWRDGAGAAVTQGNLYATGTIRLEVVTNTRGVIRPPLRKSARDATDRSPTIRRIIISDNPITSACGAWAQAGPLLGIFIPGPGVPHKKILAGGIALRVALREKYRVGCAIADGPHRGDGLATPLIN